MVTTDNTTLSDLQKQTVSLTCTDAAGARTADKITWTIDDPSICSVVDVSPPDPTSQNMLIVGSKPGTTVVHAAVGEVRDDITVTVTPGPIEKITASFGPPEPK